MDPLQSAYQTDKGVEDTKPFILDKLYTHLEKPQSHVRFGTQGPLKVVFSPRCSLFCILTLAGLLKRTVILLHFPMTQHTCLSCMGAESHRSCALLAFVRWRDENFLSLNRLWWISGKATPFIPTAHWRWRSAYKHLGTVFNSQFKCHTIYNIINMIQYHICNINTTRKEFICCRKSVLCHVLVSLTESLLTFSFVFEEQEQPEQHSHSLFQNHRSAPDFSLGEIISPEGWKYY